MTARGAIEAKELKTRVELLALVRADGVELVRAGREWKGLCPFHDEKSPSFHVNPDKQLWHCFGCGAGGDAIAYVMRRDGIEFGEALERLQGEAVKRNGAKRAETKSGAKPKIDLHERSRILEAVMSYYEKGLEKSPRARKYLENRGLAGPELTGAFRIGYSDGTLDRTTNDFESLHALFTNRGTELLRGCIVVGISDANGTVVNLYGRSITKESHLYLYPHTEFMNSRAFQSRTLVVVESVIDLLSCYVAGILNVTCTYGTNGITKQFVERLGESGVERLIIAYDGDAPGEAAAADLAEAVGAKGLETVRVKFADGSDPNDVLVREGREGLGRYFVSEEKTVEERGAAGYRYGERSYRVDGLLKNRSPGSLSVTLHAQSGEHLFIEKLELYSSKEREKFVRACSRELEIEEEIVKGDLGRLLVDLRERQDRLIEEHTKPKQREEVVVSGREREEALERILSHDDPLEEYARIMEEGAGVVGERINVEASILASVSRMMREPLHVIYQAPSAAGKSTLMKAILDTVPAENKHVFTEVSPNAFFYFDEGELVHRTIGIMEDFGIGTAAYSLKTLLTDGYLKKASTMRDPDTGHNTTRHYIAKGPVQAFTTSNNAWILEDLQNRALILILNESIEQTRAIHNRQRRSRTLDGLREKTRWERESVLLQNVHRMLRSLFVINPYADYLTFPSDSHRTRRDFDKYLTLIEAHALLCQYGRPITKERIDGRVVECIRVKKSDIERVNPIARHVFSASLDDLGPITRKLLERIREMVDERSRTEETAVSSCGFTRRDVREYTKWSEVQVRRHMSRLEQFEYVHADHGRQGQGYRYRLDERPDGDFNGLIDPESLPDEPEVRR